MLKNGFFIVFWFVYFFSPSFALAETLTPSYPGAVYQLIIYTDQYNEQNKLAKRIGFEIGRSYSYTEYADINVKYDTGAAGCYDYLLLSTGGDEWDYAAYSRFLSQPCGCRSLTLQKAKYRSIK